MHCDKVCMFHIGRSGSTVIADLLGQHPNILSDGEIYGGDPKKWTPARQQPPLDYLLDRIRSASGRIYVFEMKFWHADVIGIQFEDFFKFLQQQGFDHFIILKRRNFLRKIVSSRIAQETGAWHRSNSSSAKLVQIRIDPKNVQMDQTKKPLLAFLDGYQRDFEKLDVLLRDHLTLRLTYEEDVQVDALVGYNRICDFLGIERRPVTVRYGKTAPFPLKDILANYADIDSALAGTPFHWMVTE